MAHEQIKQSVREQGFDVWYRVDYLDNETLGSPEVMSVIGKNYKWCGPYNNCQQLTVCCSSTIQVGMMRKLSEQIGLPINLFTDVAQTKDFISEKGWGNH
ncbi:hypothetical protein HII17_14190 [Thalassotalea sp. M1531]|uniref:Uncharacterized protein n=2 Tax=Thalassotalea algicola TaxID=2716224 RepID=A0A7Y0LEE0_9GAMM|nr:hypothetical protein [Thalassotalea algicola]